ncbi:vWA domain-containing protein [Croceimicrobium hydrocarbonivorans]|uniref:VWA domain-containing protein n=1 Tax=Croceimicrobium hydrocarbonivorans TaxID=2761580 RepID=A0A7H0VDD2_9FLAO|nr:vWA domain-containing protein [Croceimicrobium hydrocarbonivorans]QNR23730.1 VWA domain-containing protein [Croceimicrobium hydrocarbonivorans]
MKPIYPMLMSLGLLVACQSPQAESPKIAENQNPTPEFVNEVIPDLPATASPDSKAPQVELVFCLDATGSMGGLIHTAKEKIWDIVSVTAQQNPAPEIRLGMVFYRDRGDNFITYSLPHTSNIDSIYTELLKIEASGGGDSPESVNQALWEAISDFKWSTSPQAYRSIFVVGDCPPHMDYPNEVRYPEACKMANQKNIRINSIKLGTQCTDAIYHFREMAKATNGEFLQLDQNASDQIIPCPQDDSIAIYSYRLDDSKLYYGSAQEKERMLEKKEKALGLFSSASSNAAASRAKYNMSESGSKNLYGNKELLNDLENNELNFEDLQEEELPEELKGLSAEDRKAKIAELQKKRSTILAKLKRLQKERDLYLKEQRKNDPESMSFSSQVFEIIKAQAAQDGLIL